MEIRVLGCHGSQLPGYGLTGFLIDGRTLVDAGAVTSVLGIEEQVRIDRVLLTHAHLDHIRDLAFLAENILYARREEPLAVIGTEGVNETLRTHIFNGTVWPDFSALPSVERPVLRFVPIRSGEKMSLGGLNITAIPVHHSVETVAYLVEDERGDRPTAAVFVGDTGPTEAVWQAIAERGDSVRAVFVETSLPGSMPDIAERSGHLTPVALAEELAKLGPFQPRIYLYHMKIQYRAAIEDEIVRMGNSHIHFLRDGQTIRI